MCHAMYGVFTEDKALRAFIKGLYDKPHLWKRIIFCVVAVCVMGFCVYWLDLIGWGTDPCSVMNIGIANKIGWTLGNWQAALNVLLFFVVIWKDKTSIGFGTLFNMFLVGYAYDFTAWVGTYLWPGLTIEGYLLKAVLMIVVLAVFVFFVGVYMSVDLGTAPYDAVPIIIAKRQSRLSFRVVRILWDCGVTLIGFLVGGVVGIVTVIMAFTIGPMAAFVGKHIGRYIS